jgi:hypothetical protein
MRALTLQQLRCMSKNLDNYFSLANDHDVESGKDWYKTANNICTDIAKEFNTTTEIVAGVISALSPRNKWEQNIKDARSVFQAINNNLEPSDIKVCTFNKNKNKAFLIAKGEVEITDKSRKTFSFVNNIAHLNNSFITVDVWHLRACFGITISKSINKTVYEQIEKLTLRKAKKHKLNGFEYQAIVWNSVKRNFK